MLKSYAIGQRLLWGVTAAGGFGLLIAAAAWIDSGGASDRAPEASQAEEVLREQTSQYPVFTGMPTPRLRPAQTVEAFTDRQVNAGFERVASGPSDLLHDSRVDGEERYCLTKAIYYEARTEPTPGQVAVAEVILNRVESRRFPNTICGVVRQGSEKGRGCHFSFLCDGSMDNRRDNELEDKAWAKAEAITDYVLLGFGEHRDLSGAATHYHADYVDPYWASIFQPTTRIGAHQFYRDPASAAS
jgi:spore germination cell wall hydrolase CwlJ-like protein